MASLPVRDPVGDHLLTPQNSALVVIDYQPSQFAGVRSMDRELLLENIVSTVKTAKAFDMPIIHSRINVATGRGQPTGPELADLLDDNPPIDRTTTNAWEDADFLADVRATARRKLIVCALWTEICRRHRDRAHRAPAEGMTAAVADPTAREFLRNADPVLARLIDAHPDFHPRAWIDELDRPDVLLFGDLAVRHSVQRLQPLGAIHDQGND